MLPFLRIRENGEYATQSIALAKEGFVKLGIETSNYTNVSQIPLSKENMVVGFVNEVRHQLSMLNISTPEIDYPVELRKYLGRKVEQITLAEAEPYMYENPQSRYFIKPVIDKQFDAIFIDYPKDLARLSHLDGETNIWISEFIKFEAEYRCYIYNQKCLAICKYKGHTRGNPDFEVVDKMASEYISSPSAYTLDVGLIDNQLYLVEVNDGYSVQNYGLPADDYAIWLMARWCELTKTEAYHLQPSMLRS